MTLDQEGIKIVRLLKNRGFSGFFVAGFVRDKLLKRQSDNLDIATDAQPEMVQKILRANKFYTREIGKKYGTILAATKAGPIEITTFRSEGDYADKRRPTTVTFIKDYQTDAKRRDFTVNSLYFEPLSKKLLDPVNGLKDLKAKLLRFVGDPKKRIDEDHLRMLRAVRLATRLNFRLEKNTFAAIKTRAKLIQDVSGERIKAELDKILASGKPAEGLRLLDKIGLLQFIIPEAEALKLFSHQSKKYHLEGSIWDHTLLAIHKARKENLVLLYALIFHDMGKPDRAKEVLKEEGWVISTKGHADVSADIFFGFAKRIKFGRHDRKDIEWLIRNHMLMFDFFNMGFRKQLKLAATSVFPLLLKHWCYDEAATKRSVYRDNHHARFLKSLRLGHGLLQRLNRLEPLIKKLANGDLIMRYTNLKPGRRLGEEKEKIKALIVLGKIKSQQDLKNHLLA